jgi:hypothetical protein
MNNARQLDHYGCRRGLIWLELHASLRLDESNYGCCWCHSRAAPRTEWCKIARVIGQLNCVLETAESVLFLSTTTTRSKVRWIDDTHHAGVWRCKVTYVPLDTKGLSVKQLAGGHLLVLWPFPDLHHLMAPIIYASASHILAPWRLCSWNASGKLLNCPYKTKLHIVLLCNSSSPPLAIWSLCLR